MADELIMCTVPSRLRRHWRLHDPDTGHAAMRTLCGLWDAQDVTADMADRECKQCAKGRRRRMEEHGG